MRYEIGDKLMPLSFIEKRLRKTLSAKRYLHSMGVCQTAAELAERFGTDIFQAMVAGLLHDCARELPNNTLLKRAVDFDIVVGSLEKSSPVLLHAVISAHLAAEEYGIDDEAILRAIALHTTGGAGMSKLDKIIFLADFIEPGRAFPGVDKLRKLAGENLDKAVLAAFDQTIRHLLEKEMIIHPASVAGRNELLTSLKAQQ